MTAIIHFDGTLHVVIASEAKQSFTHKKRYLLKGVCEKTYKKRSFYGEILERGTLSKSDLPVITMALMRDSSTPEGFSQVSGWQRHGIFWRFSIDADIFGKLILCNIQKICILK
jgi:hypothetical protein